MNLTSFNCDYIGFFEEFLVNLKTFNKTATIGRNLQDYTK
jgi:hypothetical protein